MKITLNENIFVAPKPKAKFFRQALQIVQERDLTRLTPDMLDELIQYVCDVFGSQFTINELYDELPSDELVPLVQETIEFVVGKQGNADGKKK